MNEDIVSEIPTVDGSAETSVGDTSAPEDVFGEVVEIVEEPRYFMTTPFEDYTVTEGLLLLLLLLAVILLCIKIVKGGFFWL